MMRIINMLTVVIAYACVATVIALALCLGYLWHSDRLNDEKLFHMMAILHDIDLQQIAESQHKKVDEVPPEEPSLTAVMHRQQVQDRNIEVKLLALQRAKQDCDVRLQELKTQTDRYDKIAQDWQKRLKQQEELTTQEDVVKVVNQLEQLTPEVGKSSLMLWIDEGRMDDAILLMNKMSESKLAKILKTFSTIDELKQLHEIHRRIMGGGAAQLEKALGELKSLETKN